MPDTALSMREVRCEPFTDQRPGTAGLRKKVAVFQQPHYLETFVTAILTTADLPDDATLIVGGDGRYLNSEAIQTIAELAAALGVARIVCGQHGLLSTPAASHLIRKRHAHGGIILTASHNPGGPQGDFGIKFNTAAGGQAPEWMADAVFEASRHIHGYRTADLPALDLGTVGEQHCGDFTFEVVDPVDDYLELLETLFDFDLIADYIGTGRNIIVDGLHGITGPYSTRIFVDRLGLPRENVLHAEPLPDFGGFHPDPNPVDAAHLVALMRGPDAPVMAAASDGDGDRNMILGPNILVSPGDSVAVMLANAALVPGYRSGIPGVARSMPTSRALDRVADQLGIPCYETPTGWRFFCNLLEAGRIALCGEESFGTGSSHVREKDGLWAIMFWLNMLAASDCSIPELLQRHWQQFGRHFFRREDYMIADTSQANELMHTLEERLQTLTGQSASGRRITMADSFVYRDPVDNSLSANQGLRFEIDGGGRIVFRLSGTGTSGATLRVYLEQYAPPGPGVADAASDRLDPLSAIAAEIAAISRFTGLEAPTAIV